MKKILTKRNILLGSFGVFVFVVVISNPLTFGFCQSVSEYAGGIKYCNYSYLFIDNLAENIGFIGASLSLPLFLLSLITYKMRDEVFESWVSFAKWYVPLLVIMTLLLQDGGGSGFAGAVSGWFDAMILGFLYVIFIITSFIKIIGTYWKTRENRK